MNKEKFKKARWKRRKKHIRKTVVGDAQCPRLTVFRSLRHFYAQVIDDESGFTLAAASSLNLKSRCSGGNKETSAVVGQEIAKKALDVGIHRVRFDRNGYKYHGRVRVMAEAAREAGLVF